MNPTVPWPSEKTPCLAIGMWAALALLALYLAGGVLFALDARVCRTFWKSIFPQSARVRVIEAYTPLLRTLRLEGVLPPEETSRERLMAAREAK